MNIADEIDAIDAEIPSPLWAPGSMGASSHPSSAIRFQSSTAQPSASTAPADARTATPTTSITVSPPGPWTQVRHHPHSDFEMQNM